MTNAQSVFLGEKPYGVSPSRVNQIETCPRQYQYTTIERLPEVKKMATYRGTVFHAILEELFLRTTETPQDRTPELTMEIMRELLPDLLSPEICAEMELDTAGRQSFVADLAKYIRTYFTMENPAEITSEGIEIKMDVDMGGYTLRGILDRLDRDPDGSLVIVDYKTGKVPQDKYKASATLPAKIYAYLCEKHLGERPTKIRLLYVQFGKTLTIEVTDADVIYAEKRVREAWGKIENWFEQGYFPPVKNNLCDKWCSFKNICPLFSQDDEYPF